MKEKASQFRHKKPAGSLLLRQHLTTTHTRLRLGFLLLLFLPKKSHLHVLFRTCPVIISLFFFLSFSHPSPLFLNMRHYHPPSYYYLSGVPCSCRGTIAFLSNRHADVKITAWPKWRRFLLSLQARTAMNETKKERGRLDAVQLRWPALVPSAMMRHLPAILKTV